MPGRQARMYRVWILLLLPPVLLMALTTLVAIYYAIHGPGGPEGIRAGIAGWIPYLIMLNHGVLFLLYWRFVRADGLDFAAVGWRLPAGRESLLMEPFYGLVCGIALGFFNKLFLSPVLGRLEGVTATGTGRFSIADLDESTLIPFLIAGTLFAGVVEESIYRGYAITRLRVRIGTVPAVVVSTLFFGPLHYGLGWMGIFGTMVLGAFLAIVFLWRRNLIAAAVAHAVINLIAVLF